MIPRSTIIWLFMLTMSADSVGQESVPLVGFGIKSVSIDSFALRLVQPKSIDFLGLIDAQLVEVEAIRKNYNQLADEIRNSKTMFEQDQWAELSELTGQMNEELMGVLLPKQKELLTNLAIYESLFESPLVYSMVDGLIAQQIGLTNTERRAVKRAAREAFKEYKSEIERSHHKAIERLIDSFPVDKRNGLKDLLEPMLFKGDGGLLAENTDYHFKTDNLYPEESDPKESPRTDDK